MLTPIGVALYTRKQATTQYVSQGPQNDAEYSTHFIHFKSHEYISLTGLQDAGRPQRESDQAESASALACQACQDA